MGELTWEEFLNVDARVGTIVAAEVFPEARTPAYKLTVDFGSDIGYKRSSARITDRYTAEDLIGKQVIGVVNFPPKQIGPFMSECLVTGFHDSDGAVVLAVPDAPVPNGTKLA